MCVGHMAIRTNDLRLLGGLSDREEGKKVFR